MQYKKTFAVLLLLMAATLVSQAIPARKGTFTYTQPDGSRFGITLKGDEYAHFATTTDGCAVCRGEDGWYCYARFDAQGRISSTGVRVGAPASTAILSEARNIPYAAIRSGAAGRRGAVGSMRRAHNTPTARTKSAPIKRKGLIILAQFTDLKFSYSQSDFEALINQHGYSSNGAVGCALDYFNDQFAGEYEFSFTVSPIVTLSRGYAYYGKDNGDEIDIKVPEGIAEACRLLDSSIDFSQFDGDGDGEVDNIFMFVPGKNQAEGADDDHIWPHQYYIKDGAGISCMLDGKYINAYAISSELSYRDNGKYTLAAIGTYCHEYSHALGAADIYDTDYEDSDGQSEALWGSLCLMDSGNYNNDGNTPPNYTALEMFQIGIGECETITETGLYSLQPIGTSRKYYKLLTDNEDEVFLLECRMANGWDKYIGGSGMLIYHVDMSDRMAGYSTDQKRNLTARERWEYNEVNCNPSYQCADLVEASPSARSVTQVFWPYGTQAEFSPLTSPSFTFRSGKKSTLSITDIRKSGSEVTFSVTGPVSFEATDVFQDAAIISWKASGSDNEPCVITWSRSGAVEGTAEVSPYSTGKYAYTIEGLTAKAEYTVSVRLKSDTKNSATTTITTKAYYSNGYAFIYLNSIERNTNGSISRGTALPLRVYNAPGAKEVKWYLNGSQISTGANGYYSLSGGGDLKAVVYYADGSKDIIIKKISTR